MAKKNILIVAVDTFNETHKRHKEEQEEQKKTIGSILKKMRLDAGLTLQATADILGFSKVLIHQYESGIFSSLSEERVKDLIKIYTRGKR